MGTGSQADEYGERYLSKTRVTGVTERSHQATTSWEIPNATLPATKLQTTSQLNTTTLAANTAEMLINKAEIWLKPSDDELTALSESQRRFFHFFIIRRRILEPRSRSGCSESSLLLRFHAELKDVIKTHAQLNLTPLWLQFGEAPEKL